MYQKDYFKYQVFYFYNNIIKKRNTVFEIRESKYPYILLTHIQTNNVF